MQKDHKEFLSIKGQLFGWIVLLNLVSVLFAVIVIMVKGYSLQEVMPEALITTLAYFGVLIGIWKMFRSEKIILRNTGIAVRHLKVPFFQKEETEMKWNEIGEVKGQFGRIGCMVTLVSHHSRFSIHNDLVIVASRSDLREIVASIAEHVQTARLDKQIRKLLEDVRCL
jgi:hypothetical protein